MVLAVVQSSSNASAASSAVVVTLPGAPTAGNLVVAFANLFQDRSALNGNWTDSGIVQVDANSSFCRVLYRYVQPGDTAASIQALCTANNVFWCATMIEISGVTGVWVDDFENSDKGGTTGNPVTTGTLVTTGVNSLAVCGVQCAGGPSPSGGFEAGWTEQQGVLNGYSYGIATQFNASAGASVDLTVTWAHGFTATWILLIFSEDVTIVPFRVTQTGNEILAKAAASVRVTQTGLSVLIKSTALLRVTQMGILMLARGAAGLIVPDALSLADGGRSAVIRQRLVNMYTEPTPQGPSASGRFGRPGLVEAVTRGAGPIRAIFKWKKSTRVTVSGEDVYINDFPVGTIPNPDGLPVRWAVSDEEVVVISNRRAYYVTVFDVTIIENDNLINVIDVKFQAGRFVYTLGDGSGEYFYSDVNDALTVSGTSFISAESNPDPITANEALGDALVFFGEKSTEFHYASTNPDAPFQRSQGRRYDRGTRSPHTIVLGDNTLIFLGVDRKIYRADSVPINISNDDVADRARRVSDDDLPLATAFVVSFGNHEFYVINLPGQGSWAYDFVQKVWSEWRSWNKPRFRVNVAADNVMGDVHSGKLVSFDGQTFTDLGDPLERVCSTFAPLRAGTARNFNITLMCKRGVGLPAGYGSNPVVELRYSDNQDADWSEWLTAPLGAMGQTGRASLALWINLGMMIPPGRQFEFRCTDPVEFLPYEAKINEVRP